MKSLGWTAILILLSGGIFFEAGAFTMMAFILVMGVVGYVAYDLKQHLESHK